MANSQLKLLKKFQASSKKQIKGQDPYLQRHYHSKRHKNQKFLRNKKSNFLRRLRSQSLQNESKLILSTSQEHSDDNIRPIDDSLALYSRAERMRSLSRSHSSYSSEQDFGQLEIHKERPVGPILSANTFYLAVSRPKSLRNYLKAKRGNFTSNRDFSRSKELLKEKNFKTSESGYNSILRLLRDQQRGEPLSYLQRVRRKYDKRLGRQDEPVLEYSDHLDYTGAPGDGSGAQQSVLESSLILEVEYETVEGQRPGGGGLEGEGVDEGHQGASGGVGGKDGLYDSQQDSIIEYKDDSNENLDNKNFEGGEGGGETSRSRAKLEMMKSSHNISLERLPASEPKTQPNVQKSPKNRHNTYPEASLGALELPSPVFYKDLSDKNPFQLFEEIEKIRGRSSLATPSSDQDDPYGTSVGDNTFHLRTEGSSSTLIRPPISFEKLRNSVTRTRRMMRRISRDIQTNPSKPFLNKERFERRFLKLRLLRQNKRFRRLRELWHRHNNRNDLTDSLGNIKKPPETEDLQNSETSKISEKSQKTGKKTQSSTQNVPKNSATELETDRELIKQAWGTKLTQLELTEFSNLLLETIRIPEGMEISDSPFNEFYKIEEPPAPTGHQLSEQSLKSTNSEEEANKDEEIPSSIQQVDDDNLPFTMNSSDETDPNKSPAKGSGGGSETRLSGEASKGGSSSFSGGKKRQKGSKSKKSMKGFSLKMTFDKDSGLDKRPGVTDRTLNGNNEQRRKSAKPMFIPKFKEEAIDTPKSFEDDEIGNGKNPKTSARIPAPGQFEVIKEESEESSKPGTPQKSSESNKNQKPPSVRTTRTRRNQKDQKAQKKQRRKLGDPISIKGAYIDFTKSSQKYNSYWLNCIENMIKPTVSLKLVKQVGYDCLFGTRIRNTAARIQEEVVWIEDNRIILGFESYFRIMNRLELDTEREEVFFGSHPKTRSQQNTSMLFMSNAGGSVTMQGASATLSRVQSFKVPAMMSRKGQSVMSQMIQSPGKKKGKNPKKRLSMMMNLKKNDRLASGRPSMGGEPQSSSRTSCLRADSSSMSISRLPSPDKHFHGRRMVFGNLYLADEDRVGIHNSIYDYLERSGLDLDGLEKMEDRAPKMNRAINGRQRGVGGAGDDVERGSVDADGGSVSSLMSGSGSGKIAESLDMVPGGRGGGNLVIEMRRMDHLID